MDSAITYSIDLLQRDGSTALIHACLCNHPGIVKVLLQNNPDVNLADKVSMLELLIWELGVHMK